MKEICFFIIGIFTFAAYKEEGIFSAIPLALFAAVCAIGN